MADTRKEEIREELTSARQELLSLLRGLGEWQWAAPAFAHEEEDGWSVADVLRHLTSAERGMTATMKHICEGGEGVPPDFDLNRWNARTVGRTKD
ncbi:MAG TPA: DinB family protein [Anaerolineae bacterium]